MSIREKLSLKISIVLIGILICISIIFISFLFMRVQIGEPVVGGSGTDLDLLLNIKFKLEKIEKDINQNKIDNPEIVREIEEIRSELSHLQKRYDLTGFETPILIRKNETEITLLWKNYESIYKNINLFVNLNKWLIGILSALIIGILAIIINLYSLIAKK